MSPILFGKVPAVMIIVASATKAIVPHGDDSKSVSIENTPKIGLQVIAGMASGIEDNHGSPTLM